VRRSRFAVSYDMVKQKSREEGRKAKMSKWDESHTEPIHDTPAEKDVLIRAMEAAGYTLDTIESTDAGSGQISEELQRHDP